MRSATADHAGRVRDIDPAAVARFAQSLERLGCPAPEPVAVAVSGGGDSVALLLLAAAARPEAVVAATVDHGLRREARGEAAAVARLCAMLGVPHAVLPVTVVPIRGGPQASARVARYAALADWCPARWLLTGHQRDDVAETILMRLARGSGVRGLARMREQGMIADGGSILLRPLLDWSRAELASICESAGVEPVLDPSNRDKRFDRTHARELLAGNGWLDAGSLARSAGNLAEADAALAWLAERCWNERVDHVDGAIQIDAAGLPHDTRRRLIARAIGALTGADCPAGHLDGFVRRLAEGRHASCAGIKGSPGPPWRLEHAPPRRGPTPDGDGSWIAINP